MKTTLSFFSRAFKNSLEERFRRAKRNNVAELIRRYRNNQAETERQTKLWKEGRWWRDGREKTETVRRRKRKFVKWEKDKLFVNVRRAIIRFYYIQIVSTPTLNSFSNTPTPTPSPRFAALLVWGSRMRCTCTVHTVTALICSVCRLRWDRREIWTLFKIFTNWFLQY